MILVNRNFGNPILGAVIGDMFKASSDVGQNVDWVPNTEVLATGSSLVSVLKNYFDYGSSTPPTSTYTDYNSTCNNFFIVTEQFIKTLDKVYTKIWNESFTETGIYGPSNLATIYYGFVYDNSAGASSGFMAFKKFVDRCITAGILVESDRLDYKDQIFVSGMSRANMSTQVDLANKLITMTHSSPIDIAPDINAMTGEYLAGKKLYLMMTPYLTNESIIKGMSSSTSTNATLEPFQNFKTYRWTVNGNTSLYPVQTSVKRPIAFFKPKTDASKFGRSLPMATHLFWSIGTPEDKEVALLEGKPVPDLIFDHLDRISHIDSLTLKIKFDKLQF